MFNRDWMVQFKKDLGIEWRLDNTHFTEYTFNELCAELNMAGIHIIEHEVMWGEIYAVCRLME